MSAPYQDPPASARWMAPQRVDIGVSVLDCSSRLVATARARIYDKIRRQVSTLSARLLEYYSEMGITVPRLQLTVFGLSEAVSGLSSAEILSVCQAVETAARDEGMDRVRLMEIDVAGGAGGQDDISMIPDLLSLCPYSEVSLQLASSSFGGNARDLYATALVLLLDQLSPEASSRLILSCNSELAVPSSPLALDVVSIESVNSIWPLMSAMRDELAPDACYTDTSVALTFIGTKVSESGLALQTVLLQRLRSADIHVSGRTTRLSIDAPGEGPIPAGIWCGLPLSAYAGAASSKAAASLLRQRLSSGPSASFGQVESDHLPLSDSIRNIHAVSADTAPADLAGSLVRMFSQAVASGARKYVKVVAVDSASSSHGISLDFADGTIPFLPAESGWSADHFSNGGLLLSPAHVQRYS